MGRFQNILKGVVAIATISVLGYWAGTLADRYKDPEPKIVSHGEADVGGPFDLMDTSGTPFSDKDLLGKFSLIYFGYTHCPDVCPLDMNRISMALEILERDFDLGETLQPVFISVDPARDTPEVLALFLEGYHPTFIGLTGTQAQMEKAAGAYKVYWEKIRESEHGGHNSEAGLIGHSSNFYLMDPSGKFVTFYDNSFPARDLADDIAKRLD